ncbi:cyclopropane fatty-acyl-phospholipid synthase-like methyltransferase [Azospirillum lipoferum]|uniref:Class I SAM-dependent methyltransferase n=1 Tax=Azospirillum lipoferum TaxID=193 RepID=A0A5A9GU66_AZOLI|nr:MULTISPECIES: class I SAM-dependent methyltransferase [Azospirillum]KAA0598018.1 class I SAM-dependent methyltransferase [Azospirillum lipoferum]MCP1613872.1 cyclopropane fatty-acyl-phospholipid synthase-like methyltransferase [Azospirillum lipoferum]MDW5534675.1 class I SAM-dependent methyltransferase [Azospirillum sp. NL1]
MVPQISPQDLERWRNPDWRIRLAAWWEGYDLSRLPRVSSRADLRNLADRRRPGAVDAVGTASLPGPSNAIASPGIAPDPAPPGGTPELDRLALMQLDRHGEPVWSPARSEGAQLLWGQDMTGPEEASWMVDSVRSFGLTPAKSVLDLSAGLGGTARALVESCDTWVTGLEPSPLLAKLAMDRSKALGLSKKAPIAHYDPEHFNQAGSFDLVMADRIVHRVRDKELFLDRLGDCVKPKGGIALFDYVIDGTPGSWDSWNGWREEEPMEVYPWTATRMADELTQRNLDVRITEDLTQLHRRHIIDRVRKLADTLAAAVPPAPVLAALKRELALWWARLRVLGSGLRFVRYVAMKPA